MATLTLEREADQESGQQCLDSDKLFEIIDGQEVELPDMAADALIVANRLMRRIGRFTDIHGLGEPFVEMLVQLDIKQDKARRPDVIFVTTAKLPKTVLPRSKAWPVVPELVVEVVSPTDMMEEVLEKVEEYFVAGVQQVWLVHPRFRRIDVFEDIEKMVRYTGEAVITCPNIILGFELNLKELFEV
jgi:Uma2 family endonuclease